MLPAGWWRFLLACLCWVGVGGLFGVEALAECPAVVGCPGLYCLPVWWVWKLGVSCGGGVCARCWVLGLPPVGGGFVTWSAVCPRVWGWVVGRVCWLRIV